MKDSVLFSVRYDGSALSDHSMDVRELSPALMALSDLIEEANKVALPGSPAVRLSVRGRFKTGSFGIDLVAAQTFAEQVVALFSGQQATAITTMLSGLGLLGGGGLIGLIKWLRGRKPTAVRQIENKTVIECQGTETIETYEVDLVTGRLYHSRVVRQALASTLKPLERDGIDSFAVSDEAKEQVIVTSDELIFFTAAAEDEEIVSDVVDRNILLQIESVVFKERNKWRFSDGSATFHAEILDADFLARIDAGERFGKLDTLLVDLQRIQVVTDNGLKIRHIIIRVHDHREPLQRKLI